MSTSDSSTSMADVLVIPVIISVIAFVKIVVVTMIGVMIGVIIGITVRVVSMPGCFLMLIMLAVLLGA